MTADGFGAVKYDVGYGGGFYILADINQLKMNLETTPVAQLIEAGVAIKEAVKCVTNKLVSDNLTMLIILGQR